MNQPRLELRSTKERRYYFELRDERGDVVLGSASYMRKGSALTALRTCRERATLPEAYSLIELRERGAAAWSLAIMNPEGHHLAVSPAFATLERLERARALCMRSLAAAAVHDRSNEAVGTAPEVIVPALKSRWL